MISGEIVERLSNTDRLVEANLSSVSKLFPVCSHCDMLPWHRYSCHVLMTSICLAMSGDH